MVLSAPGASAVGRSCDRRPRASSFDPSSSLVFLDEGGWSVELRWLGIPRQVNSLPHQRLLAAARTRFKWVTVVSRASTSPARISTLRLKARGAVFACRRKFLGGSIPMRLSTHRRPGSGYRRRQARERDLATSPERWSSKRTRAGSIMSGPPGVWAGG